VSKKIKILIVTHSAVLSTGMAETTRLIFNTLLNKYPNIYEIHQIGLKHVHAVTTSAWPIYPTKAVTLPDGGLDIAKDDLHGKETFQALLPSLKPDIVFALNDPQNVEYLCVDATKRNYKLVLYVNFDGFPAAKAYNNLFKADRVMISTDFGKHVFLSGNPSHQTEKVDSIYKPADITRFVPVSDVEKIGLRQDLFPPWMPTTAFVLGWVGFNQWRKQVWVLYQLIHLLRTGRYLICPECERAGLIDSQSSTEFPMSGAPRGFTSCAWDSCPYCGSPRAHFAEPLENVFLWLHMLRDSLHGAWPVDLLETLYNVKPGRDIHYTEGIGERSHLAPEDMPTLYQLWDALLYLSAGEGFGLPAWEAMCTALPIVYTNYSSHAELIGNPSGGLPVRGVLQPEPRTCTLRLVPDISQTLQAVRRLYFNRQIGIELGKNGRAFVQGYANEVQAERWHRLFQEVVKL